MRNTTCDSFRTPTKISLSANVLTLLVVYSFIINPRSIKITFCFVNVPFPSVTRSYRQFVNVFIVTRLINREIFAFDKRCFSIDYFQQLSRFFSHIYRNDSLFIVSILV